MPTGVNGLCTILIHAESGEYLMDSFIMPVSKPNDPQAVGSAITYAKRYALAGILALNIDDDDGNKAAEKPGILPVLMPGTEKWAKVLEALKQGYTMAQIKSKNQISKENETRLLNELEQA
jgi:hypothetical protein